MWNSDDSLAELGQLAESVGAKVLDHITQKIERPTSTYLGKGKLEALVDLTKNLSCTVAIFDDELTPAQQRSLEDILKIKVIDRTALILDVFSRHARTYEGKLQVELAQHQYLLPRLAGQWAHLERLGGGIGTRGPGETQLETDRRLVRNRIQKITGQLDGVRRRRTLYMGRRKKAGIPSATLVGYTNAGKSSLFNALSDAEVTAADQLFSTLDPVTRRVHLPSGGELLLTDTVGFIQKLSPKVVAAFRATLEQASESDILLHVVDVTHAKAPEQTQVVEATLKELGLANRPRILVLNKVDLLGTQEEDANEMPGPGFRSQPTVLVSAAKSWNLDVLLNRVESLLMAVDGPALVVRGGR